MRLSLLATTIVACGALSALGVEAPAKPNDGPFAGLKMRSLGPSAGGRVTRVAGVPGDPLTYYFAAASGGVWKSTDGGARWESLFDDQPISSIGSIAVAASDPNVVYVGSGEANIRGNVAPGNGIYKSIDAGKSWTQVWQQVGQIGTMIVHPKNPDVAFAAVLGHAFGPNPERGVYRTRDGGKTWQQVLKKDADTGASDVAFDPSNPNIVFAGLWQARRRPWELTSGGPGSGLYVSRDGGETWKQLAAGEKGLPAGIWGKLGVAVAPSDGRRVYALIEAEQGGLYRSDDGGETWSLANGHRALRQRAWYYSTLTVDPSNKDVVWFPQVPLLKTVDAGKTIVAVIGAHHGDHHDVWIDPQNPRRMIGGNDGGVDVSLDGGEHWLAPALPISQFYHLSVDNAVPYHVMGAMQDLGTAWGPSNSLTPRIRRAEWRDVGGGEAGHVVARPDDPNVVYAGEYGGYITRYDHRTRQARNVSAYPENPSGHGAEDLRYRFQWTAPIATSPHDPNVVYHGGNVLFRSTDGGQGWQAISGDLTRNDTSKQKWSGGPITGDNTGVEIYGTIFALCESPRERGLIWAGSDDGLVHLTRDGGKSWSNLSARIPGLPEWGTVTIVEPSPHDAGSAYVVVDAHRLDDLRPYLWKTSDYGQTWKSLTRGLASDVHLRVVREDPKKRGQLYLGTERGLMWSSDDGANWQALKVGLPTVAVSDLVVKGDDLVVSTQGRSLWVLDGGLTALREWSPELAKRELYMFPAATATRWRYAGAGREPGAHENRPAGAIIDYYLAGKPKGEIKLEIKDARGRLVRTLSSNPERPELPKDDPDGDGDDPPKPALAVEPGVQRVVWNLAWEGATKIKQAKLDAGDPKQGPLALPGSYTLALSVDGKTATGTLTIEPDPRVTVPLAELEQQLELSLRMRDALTRLSGLVERLRAIRQQASARAALARGEARLEGWVKSGEALVARCDALESRLHNPKAEVVYDILAQKGGAKLYSRLAPLFTWLNDADGAPPQGTRELFAEQERELQGHAAEFDALLEDVDALNRQGQELALPLISKTAPAP